MKKLENTLYELSLTANGGLVSKPEDIPEIDTGAVDGVFGALLAGKKSF